MRYSRCFHGNSVCLCPIWETRTPISLSELITKTNFHSATSDAPHEYHQWWCTCWQSSRHPGMYDSPCPIASTMAERVRMGAEYFITSENSLNKRGLATSGGRWRRICSDGKDSTEISAIATIIEAIKSAGYTTEQIKIALDIASTEFFKDRKYNLAGENKVWLLLKWWLTTKNSWWNIQSSLSKMACQRMI